MTGAGFYSAIGHAKLLTKSQPNRYLASFSMGLLGAYVGGGSPRGCQGCGIWGSGCRV